MTVFYSPEVRIARRGDGRLVAALPGGESLSFPPHAIPPVPELPDAPTQVCSTLDHVVAAAGW